MICDRFRDDSQFATLFEYVRFEYLSSESIQSFISLMEEGFDFLTFAIWQSVCRRLSLPVSISNSRKCNRYYSHLCAFSTISCFDGIISYLTTRCGGNIVDQNIVSIKASSLPDERDFLYRQLVDFACHDTFYTVDEPNSWICYDFKEISIDLSHYSIRSRFDCDDNHLRSWILEGSNEGSSWVDIDRREHDCSLKGQGTIATFSISEGSRNDFRMFRLRQTGKDSSGCDYLCLSAVEFFGYLKGQGINNQD
jgi:hypothetical protein